MQPLGRALSQDFVQLGICMPCILLLDTYLKSVLTWVCKGTFGDGDSEASWRIMPQLETVD